MPLHGLVHDSPLITAAQQATRRGRKAARNDDTAEREVESLVWLWRKLGFKEEWLAEPYRNK